MDVFLQDLRYALRSLARRPGFAAVAILTLALGVGATTTIFSVVEGVLLRPLPFRRADRLVALWQTSRQNPGGDVSGSVSHVNFLDWQERAKSFQSMALYSSATVTLSGPEEAEVAPAAVVTPDFFRVFLANPVLGRGFTREEDQPGEQSVVVVSYGFWQDRLGGQPDIVGRTVELSGRPRVIVGVAPAGFDFPHGARFWFPVRNDDQQCGRDCVYLDGVARLAPGVTLTQAQDELRRIAAQLEAEYPVDHDVTVAASTLQQHLVGDVRQALLVLMFGVVMVLLIACANVANLLLARGAARRDEVAVRAALGAGRPRLVRQLLTESLALGGVGGGIGILLARWGVDALRFYTPGNIPRLDEVALNAPAVLFAAGLVLATTVVFGLAPALKLARTPLLAALRQGNRGDSAGPRAAWGRSTLIIVEVALSLMLLLGAGLLLRSFARMQAVDPGFRTAGIAEFTLSLPGVRYPSPEQRLNFIQRLQDELGALPGVQAVSRVQGIPLGPGEEVFDFTRPDQPRPQPGLAPSALSRLVGPGYFELLDLPLVAGRTFRETDRAGSLPVVIINRALADRYFPDTNPVGKQIVMDTTRTIVGMVANTRSRSLTQEPQPEVYRPDAQTSLTRSTVLVRTAGKPAAVLAAARRIVRAEDPKLPLIRAGTLGGLLDAQLARPRFYFLLLGLFAFLAVALSAVGLYGVVAYVVSRRTREIGVRMALGAAPREVVLLVLRQGMGPALLGAGIGLAGALAAARLMAGLLFEVPTYDPLVLAGATGLLMAVAGGACSVPARRATRVPPSTALRVE